MQSGIDHVEAAFPGVGDCAQVTPAISRARASREWVQFISITGFMVIR